MNAPFISWKFFNTYFFCTISIVSITISCVVVVMLRYSKILDVNINANKTPAPKNFWPYSYQFYLCNPVKIFDCNIYNANSIPKIKIKTLVKPEYDRSKLNSELMPTSLLSEDEISILINKKYNQIINYGLIKKGDANSLKKIQSNKKKFIEMVPYINEDIRDSLDLRDTDKPAFAKSKYTRT